MPEQIQRIVETEMLPRRFDAVVVCGMGPLGLRPTPHTEPGVNLVASNLHNFLNALAGKLTAAHGLTDTVIMSGWQSQKGEGDDIMRIVERATSEAKLLVFTAKRAHLKGITAERQLAADAANELDERANTMFGNIIQVLNRKDRETANGLWEGKLGVVSSIFHGPRLELALRIFGVNGEFVAAEPVMNRFGYKNVYPHDSQAWRDLLEATYKGQPRDYMNLRDNTSYAIKYLAEAESPRRLQQMAASFRSYIQEHKTEPVPDILRELPQEYDEHFDYAAYRARLAAVPVTKRDFPDQPTVPEYKQMAAEIAQKTKHVLSL